MNYEESRLRTFEKWPGDAAVDARRIARAGFYYMGQGLEVQCFSCGARISEWSYGDKVMARHRSLDPGCGFVRNPALSGNVPIVNEHRRLLANNRTPTLRARTLTQASTDARYRSFEARLQSFSDWPIPFIVSAEQLAHSGFYYTKTADQVQCAFCSVLVGRWEPGDDPDTEHTRHNTLCPYMNQRTRVSELERTSEFNVPDLSSADNRNRDEVRCFHCDGGLRCWEKSDIPWEEHARCFPYCAFVDLIKGQQYIDQARMSRQPVINEGRENVAKPTSSVLTRVRSVTEAELQELMSTDCAVTALQVGIEASRVKLALRQKVEQTGVSFSSADALIVAALDIQSEENNADEINETWTTPPDSPIIGCGRRNSRRRYTLSSSDESDRDEVEPFSTSSNEKVKSCSKVVTSSEQPQVPDNPDQNKLPAKLTLEEENRRLKEARLCKICMVNEVHVVFVPCGHLLTCVQCAHGLINCPVCRQLIKATVRAFLS